MSVVKHIDLIKYEITFILALDEGGKQERELEALDLGIQIYRTSDLDGFQKKLNHVIRLKQLLKETGPYDIVHSNMDFLNGINLLVANTAGIATRISHSHVSNSQHKHKTFLKKVIFLSYRKIMMKMINITATDKLGCSDNANIFLYGKKEVNKGNTKVIYNGIDVNRFSLQNKDKNNIVPKFNKNKERFNLITVGRISNAKNPFFLIDIAKELVKIRQDFCITWVGKGELEKEVHQKITDNNLEPYFKMLGLRDDVPDLLANCDLFIFPSIFEGLGIVLIEAQASGLDCLVSENVPKLVNLGKCSFLPLKIENWVNTINEYMNVKEKMKIDGDKLNLFSVENTVNQLDAIYSNSSQSKNII
ncbi:MAG: glycosyltransferase [Bacilli bacterium]